MKNLLLLSLLLICTLFACKPETLPLPKEDIDFYPLAVGNYWIYDVYTIDSLGEASAQNRQDTIQITAQVATNGHNYFRFEGTQFGADIEFLRRDSSGFLVDENGTIFFTSTAFNQELRRDSINPETPVAAVLTYQQSEVQMDITTDAGTFNCYNYEGTIDVLDPDYPHGVRKSSYYLSPTIGLILHEAPYFSTKISVQQQLVEYHLE